MTQPFTGLLAYPITPLTHDDEPDLGALAQLVRGACQAGVSGVTVLATSGAGVTFDRGERSAVVQAAKEAASAGEDTLPVYAAVSAAATREVLDLARDAEQAGADGLVLTPFSYLPLSDGEVRALFLAVSDATELPLCFYNKPQQTQYDLSPQTLAYLADAANVVAVKETMRRPDVNERVAQFRDVTGNGFCVGLSSDVHLLQELPDVDAWHTGLAGLLPREYARVWQLAMAGEQQGAELSMLASIAQTLAGMPHPIGALHALSKVIGFPTEGPRGPFSAATQEETWQLSSAINRQF